MNEKYNDYLIEHVYRENNNLNESWISNLPIVMQFLSLVLGGGLAAFAIPKIVKFLSGFIDISGDALKKVVDNKVDKNKESNIKDWSNFAKSSGKLDDFKKLIELISKYPTVISLMQAYNKKAKTDREEAYDIMKKLRNEVNRLADSSGNDLALQVLNKLVEK